MGTAALAMLVAVQWVAVAVFALGVERNGWLFYQGGDQSWFYTSAWVLANGYVPETLVGWVWALAMTPIAAIAGPSYFAGVSAVVILQYALLLPLGLLLVYAIASRIGGRWLGYWAGAWWIVVPFGVIPFFVDRYHDTYVVQTLPQVFGLTGLGDFPSMIAVLAAAYFAVRAIETNARPDAVAAGLLAGLAIGIKPANGLFAFAPLAALAVAKHWRRAAEFAFALVPGLLVLAIWKLNGSGIALLSLDEARLAAGSAPDYTPPTRWERLRMYVPLDVDQLNYQFLGLREFFYSARVVEFVPVAGAIAVARRSVPFAVLFGAWLAAFFVVKGSHDVVNVETGSIWRLLMPAWPAYFLLGASIPLLVPRIGGALATAHRPLRPFRAGKRALVAAVALVFAIPAATFAALPSDPGGRAVKFAHFSLFVPIDPSFRLTATPRDGGVVDLSWSEPATGTVRPFYVVLRAPTQSALGDEPVVRGFLCRHPGGAVRCTAELEEVGRTRERTFRTSPDPGAWTYRVALAANWRDDEDAGDILLVTDAYDLVAR